MVKIWPYNCEHATPDGMAMFVKGLIGNNLLKQGEEVIFRN